MDFTDKVRFADLNPHHKPGDLTYTLGKTNPVTGSIVYDIRLLEENLSDYKLKDWVLDTVAHEAMHKADGIFLSKANYDKRHIEIAKRAAEIATELEDEFFKNRGDMCLCGEN
jgi:hypothetical protein